MKQFIAYFLIGAACGVLADSALQAISSGVLLGVGVSFAVEIIKQEIREEMNNG